MTSIRAINDFLNGKNTALPGRAIDSNPQMKKMMASPAFCDYINALREGKQLMTRYQFVAVESAELRMFHCARRAMQKKIQDAELAVLREPDLIPSDAMDPREYVRDFVDNFFAF